MTASPTSDEIKAAMLSGTPAEFDGIEYARISAYTFRVGEPGPSGIRRTFFQVELEGKSGNSVIIANPKNIRIKERV